MALSNCADALDWLLRRVDLSADAEEDVYRALGEMRKALKIGRALNQKHSESTEPGKPEERECILWTINSKVESTTTYSNKERDDMTEKAITITVKCLDGSEKEVAVPVEMAVELSIVKSVILKGRSTDEELSLVRRQGIWQEVPKEELEELWEHEARADAEAEERMRQAAQEEITELQAQEERLEEVEQARAYLAEQGFHPRKVGEEWQIVYPASGRPGTLTDEELIEKAHKVEQWHALPAVRRCNPTIGC